MLFSKPKNDTVICSIYIGETTSSVSFLYFGEKDELQNLSEKVHRVKWENNHAGITIPSQIRYPTIDRTKSSGAEPESGTPGFCEVGVFEHLVRIGNVDFKPGLCTVESLGLTAEDILRDWIRHLLNCAFKSFDIGKVTPKHWEERFCMFVTPTQWNLSSQRVLRKIIHETEWVADPVRLQFATAAESTLYYALAHKTKKLTSPVKLGFILCNLDQAANGINFYTLLGTDPLCCAEKQCLSDPPLENPSGSTVLGDKVVNRIKFLLEEIPSVPKFVVLVGGYGHSENVRKDVVADVNSFIKRSSEMKKTTSLINLTKEKKPSVPIVDGALYGCFDNFQASRSVPDDASEPEEGKLTLVRRLTDGIWRILTFSRDYVPLSSGFSIISVVLFFLGKEPADADTIRAFFSRSSKEGQYSTEKQTKGITEDSQASATETRNSHRIESGTYFIRSVRFQQNVKLANNSEGSSVELDHARETDEEMWAIKAEDDGTFTIRNKKWAENAFAAASHISAGQEIRALNRGTPWKWHLTANSRFYGRIVASSQVWEATPAGKIELKQMNKDNLFQEFEFRRQ